MKIATIIATAFVLFSTQLARADGCNIANVLFGKVRIELIQHQGYETGIIFGGDFDSQRFAYEKILGQIASPERDGSRAILNANGERCGRILEDLSIDISDAECGSCSKAPINLTKVSPNSFAVVIKGGSIVGTINGRLNR